MAKKHDLLTVEEAAKVIRVTPGRVRQLAADKTIDHSRFGRVILFDRAEVERYATKRRNEALAKYS